MINGKLTAEEVADILGIKNKTSITNLASKGKLHGEKTYIPAYDVNGRGRNMYLFDEADVMKYMEDMAAKVDKGKMGHKFNFLKTKEKFDNNIKELTRNVTGGPIVKDAHVDISEEGMRFTAYGKPIGKDPKECSTPVTPLDKRHLFANNDGFEKFVGDELEQKYKDYPEYTPRPFDEVMKEVKGLKQTIKLDGSTDIYIDIDARHITYQYVRSLTDEEFGIFIQKCVNDRLKRK